MAFRDARTGGPTPLLATASIPAGAVRRLPTERQMPKTWIGQQPRELTSRLSCRRSIPLNSALRRLRLGKSGTSRDRVQRDHELMAHRGRDPRHCARLKVLVLENLGDTLLQE